MQMRLSYLCNQAATRFNVKPLIVTSPILDNACKDKPVYRTEHYVPVKRVYRAFQENNLDMKRHIEEKQFTLVEIGKILT